MSRLFKIQPEWCRAKLDTSNINLEALTPKFKRIALFDPKEAYERINESDCIDPFSRNNSVEIGLIFPKQDGICACGCGSKLEGRRKVWATDECHNFAVAIQCVFTGHFYTNTIMSKIFGTNCIDCKIEQHLVTHELDHKFPVKFGGAGGWLSNYCFRCKECHRIKTNKDFGFNQFRLEIVNQTKLF